MTQKNHPVIAVGIDHGFSSIKLSDDDFPTAIAQIDDPITQDNVLMIDGKSYRIGGKRIEVLEDKASTDSFRLLTYAAIARRFDSLGIKQASVFMAAGLPIGRIAIEKSGFKKYLMEPKEVKFHYQGKAYIVSIEDVLIFPQCYGAVAHRIPSMKSEEVVVDIGSWTVDTLKIIDHSPDESSSGSDPNGLIPCMRHIDEECMRLFNCKIGENIIKDIMITGTADVGNEYIKVVEDELKAYTIRIYRILREMGISVKTTPITFVGGGASLMRKYSGLTDKNIRYIEDVRANAAGYELMLRAYLKSKGISIDG